MGKGGTIRLFEAPSRIPRQWDPSHTKHILNDNFTLASACAQVSWRCRAVGTLQSTHACVL